MPGPPVRPPRPLGGHREGAGIDASGIEQVADQTAHVIGIEVSAGTALVAVGAGVGDGGCGLGGEQHQGVPVSIGDGEAPPDAKAYPASVGWLHKLHFPCELLLGSGKIEQEFNLFHGLGKLIETH